MLTIRPEQFVALEAARRSDFEARALVHLRRWMPRHAALLGDEGLRQLVRRGLPRAAGHGLGAECTVLGYLDLMCLLGSSFDLDPLLPWAAEILGEPHRDPVEKGDRLYDAAWAYIDRIVADYRDEAGRPRTARLVDLLKEVRAMPEQPFDEAGPAAFAAELQATLDGWFAAKVAVVGGERVAALALAARQRALHHRLHGLRGTRVVAILMFLLGHGFDDDPLLPWIPPILDTADDERTRVDRLLATGAETLRRWWALEHRPAVADA